MVRDFINAIPTIQSTKAFWLEGAGGKAFCAGGDVKALFEKGASVADRLAFFREEFLLDLRLSEISSAQISCWDGIVMGGGFGVSGFSPFIIATENTIFAMPENKLGFFTDVGSSYRLSRLRGHLGHYLALTGARLKGEDLFILGLANYYIPRESIPAVFA
ncbi:unnamed protein product [Sphagnum balticum]